MPREERIININEMQSLLDFLRLAEEVQKTKEPTLLRQDGELLELRVAKPAKRTRRKGQPIREDDPLWDIVGMAHSDGPGDVADNVDKYLAEAILSNEA